MGVTDDMAARLVASWMPDDFVSAVYKARSANNPISPQLWNKLLDLAEKSGDFPHDLQRKCRPFSWYAHNINPDLKPPKTAPETEVNNVIKLKTSSKEKRKMVEKPKKKVKPKEDEVVIPH